MGGFTRRRFLEAAGLTGGAAALLEAATALDMFGRPEAWAGPPPLRQGSGNGQTVVILGAGVGGLTACYELSKAGYQCVILEAQRRSGGRSLTVRNGDTVTERNSRGELVEQVCRFDEGLYLNMGPGRLPYHHRRALHYCRELGVALEPYIMHTTANLFQSDSAFASGPRTARQIGNDTRGRLSELLATALRNGDLDGELSPPERDALADLLRFFGNVDADGRYRGSTRAGCAPGTPSVYEDCLPLPPIPLSDLLSARFWQHMFYQPDDYEWQPTLFQPIGGMDKIVQGFLAKLPTVTGRPIAEVIRYEHVVTEIRMRADGVEVTYRDAAGASGGMKADYCVCNIPLPILNGLDNNFSGDFRRAVAALEFGPAFKVGWQANQRFWEEKYQIYGGISYINHPITQMWYPSNDYFTAKGTMTGAYAYDDQARMFGELEPAQRLRIAKQGGARLHAEFLDDAIVPTRLGMSIAWQNVPFQAGGWPEWTDTPEQRVAYSRILSPEGGRFFIVGDQASKLPGWQEGAMESAQHVVEQIAGLRTTEIRPVEHTPITAIVVGAAS